MRFAPITLILLVLAAVVCGAQDQSPTQATQAVPAHEPESYLVRLTEFRLEDAADAELEARDVATALDELKKSGKFQLIETVQISALESHESVAQFGKRVAVTTGTAENQFGRQRQMQERAVGTQVQLKAVPQNGKVLLNLTYEASRLSEVENEDGPPDTLNTRCNTTVLLEPGVPQLLSATSANASAYLLISITKK